MSDDDGEFDILAALESGFDEEVPSGLQEINTSINNIEVQKENVEISSRGKQHVSKRLQPQDAETPPTKKLKSLSSSVTDKKSKELVPEYKAKSFRDKFSGFYVDSPFLNQFDLEMKMTGREAIPLNRLGQYKDDSRLKNIDWVVFGIIVQKLPIRKSANGAMYSMWRLSNLHDDGLTVMLFLFRNCHEALWKEPSQLIVGILNPTFLENNSKNDSPAITISNPLQLMKIGYSSEFGYCKATTTQGKSCQIPVNITNCEYCKYHLQKSYKNIRSKRGELQHGVPDPRKHTNGYMKKLLSNSPGFAYNGKLYNNEAITTVKSPNHSLIKKHEKNESNNCHTMQEKNKLLPSKLLQERLNIPTAGTRNLLSHLSDKSSTSLDSNLATKESNKYPKFSDMFNDKVRTTSSYKSMTLNEIRKLKAAKTVQSIAKADPNNPFPSRLNSLKRDSIKKRFEREFAMDSQIENVKASNLVEKVLALSTKFTSLVEEEEFIAQEKYFKQLEFKEKLENKMSTTYFIECNVVICKICRYLAHSLADKCKSSNHPVKWTKATKRFFQCENCKTRTYSFQRYPTQACNCGCYKFNRASMLPNHHKILTDVEKFYITEDSMSIL